MLTLSELSAFNQRQVEQLFAAQVFSYPVYSIATCGWLDPAIICEPAIKDFWVYVRDNLTVSSDDRIASTIVTQAAVRFGIQQDLITWRERFPGTSEPAAFAQEISRRAYMTRMSVENNRLAQAIGSGDDLAVREIIQKMHMEVPAMQSNLPTAIDVNLRFMALVDSGIRAIATFIPKVDTKTGGLERKTLTMLGGRPGMGKTAIGGQIARNVAESGKRVIFFSLEMSAEGLWQRWACPLVGVEWRDVISGNITRQQKEELKRQATILADRLGDRLMIPDTPQTTETIWRIVATVRPDFIVIDHIRRTKDKAENENKRLGYITEALSDIAKAHDIPVLALVQLNRDLTRRDNKRPNLADIRDSGEVEENADNVWFLHRPDYYDDQVPKIAASKTEFIVAKFRNGPADVMIKLDFNMRQEWFE